MSSYQEQSDLYRGSDRARYEACIREQALIFVFDGRADIAALGAAIVGGSLQDVDAVIAGICFGPNSADLGQDPALLSAVQAVFPTVAAARFPQ